MGVAAVDDATAGTVVKEKHIPCEVVIWDQIHQKERTLLSHAEQCSIWSRKKLCTVESLLASR